MSFLFFSILVCALIGSSGSSNNTTTSSVSTIEPGSTTIDTPYPILLADDEDLEDLDVTVSVDFLHFYNFLDDEKILPTYMVLAVEWKTKQNFVDQFTIGQLIDDPSKWLPLLEQPDLFVESSGAKSIMDEENEYKYLVFNGYNRFTYITRLYFQLNCNVNGPLYPHEMKRCRLFVNSVYGLENRFKLKWKSLALSQNYLPGFLIQRSGLVPKQCGTPKLIHLPSVCLLLELQFRRIQGVQLYVFYIPTIVFALIAYSNFFIPIIALTGRFLIISVPLVSILIVYQQVPEFTEWTFIDVWFSFFFFYILSMFGVLLVALKEFASESHGPNQYQQALLNNETDKSKKEMAFSNWKQHLKEQTEQQHSSLVSVSSLRTDYLARLFCPVILAVFLLIYGLLLFSMRLR